MQVTKVGDKLAVVLPRSVVESHDLKEGDEVDVEIRSASIALSLRVAWSAFKYSTNLYR